ESVGQSFRPVPTSTLTEFLMGAKKAVPIVIASTPFGLLFGAVAVDSGLSIGEAVFMSATIYAGASQLVGLDLFGKHIAPWMIMLSVFAVNFRHVLYSAAVGLRIKHCNIVQQAAAFFVSIDRQYAEVQMRSDAGLNIASPWYMGLGLSMYVFWVTQRLIGALF